MRAPLVQGEQVLFRFEKETEVNAGLRQVLDAGGRVLSVTPQKRSLEEIFLAEVRAERGR
jgi:hypothetical protein